MPEPLIIDVCDGFWEQATEYLSDIGRGPDDDGIITLDGLAIRLHVPPPPTPEEIARREAYYNSPRGRRTAEIARAALQNITRGRDFYVGGQWSDADAAAIGSTLRIRLPSNYTLSDGPLDATQTQTQTIIYPITVQHPPTLAQRFVCWLKSWRR